MAFEGDKKMEDIDTSLLFPDVIMEVENDPITTRNESNLPGDSDQTSSPYDYNITGCKATFKLSDEDHRLKKALYTAENPVQNTKIHCTACNAHLGSAIKNMDKVFVHPLLKVIVCNECFDYYSSGCFEKDEDGSELFCRWCGQGGKVICCSSCPMVFCKLCIRMNFCIEKYAEIRDKDEWKCFVCEPSQIRALRVHCLEFADYVRKEILRLASVENLKPAMEKDHTFCCSPSRATRKRLRVKDPDYVPHASKTTDAEEEQEDEIKKTRKLQKEDPEVKNPAKQNRPGVLGQDMVIHDHSYCLPPAQETSKNPPRLLNLDVANKNPVLPQKPADASIVSISRVPPLTLPTSLLPNRFLVKQNVPLQKQPTQGEAVAIPNEKNVTPLPFLILKDSKMLVNVLKNGKALPVIRLKQRAPEGGSKPGGEGLAKPPIQFLRIKRVEKLEKASSSEEKPTLQLSLDEKFQLTKTAIQEATLVNGIFGSNLMKLNREFSKAKYLEDFIRINNELQRFLILAADNLLKVHRQLLQVSRDREVSGKISFRLGV
ncbi:uncharacterized protein isoform X1 [Leptinotarsa decemlineata]|uniref:uncharacterized protein isoform X1 n=2 Tax=Leptinotarsa decemlineata TaxID=7539 RepID=UPI003D30AD71